ncbi:hypothetical protein ColLi_13916 [Colletotrichum liriopes]|uniref:Uncharacterized protein n=1 Tax=Colletotrichum liriopes TaxID=708192 RepID=A0AA37LXY7_9PEZI|nr:hypothetical protein ColLi_10989 [Colletotrichum liriopes]GJC90034.1 hypothetical protein ColLi_12872 [Colletotrichum liriopes]GJC90474.1 hypothetical protein ColLi_13312 [Colletotrichum liriopes]GJC91078.1 hypothetical protein ColLi_13916 [Colletotrichum liriopes]
METPYSICLPAGGKRYVSGLLRCPMVDEPPRAYGQEYDEVYLSKSPKPETIAEAFWQGVGCSHNVYKEAKVLSGSSFSLKNRLLIAKGTHDTGTNG